MDDSKLFDYLSFYQSLVDKEKSKHYSCNSRTNQRKQVECLFFSVEIVLEKSVLFHHHKPDKSKDNLECYKYRYDSEKSQSSNFTFKDTSDSEKIANDGNSDKSKNRDRNPETWTCINRESFFKYHLKSQ